MNFTARGFLSSLRLLPSTFYQSSQSFFRHLRSSSFSFFFSLDFSSPLIAARVSSAFICFYAFKSISAIILGGFFARETTNSLDFNPALKVVNCTLSSASSTSKVPRVKCVTYDLKVSFSPCLMVGKWSAGLFGRYPSTKWWRKVLPRCSKLSMDDVGSLVNHSLAAPLRVVGKERHSISSGGCCRPKVI